MLRVAPALETKRAMKTTAMKAKKAAAAARSAERETAYFTVHGVDLRAELRKLWALPIARELRAKLHPLHRITPPTLSVQNRSAATNRYGVANSPAHTIRINRIPGHDAHTVRDTLAHELAHILTPRAHHGIAWKTAYRLLCEQGYGVRPRVERRYIDEAHVMMRAAAGDAKENPRTTENGSADGRSFVVMVILRAMGVMSPEMKQIEDIVREEGHAAIAPFKPGDVVQSKAFYDKGRRFIVRHINAVIFVPEEIRAGESVDALSGPTFAANFEKCS